MCNTHRGPVHTTLVRLQLGPGQQTPGDTSVTDISHSHMFSDNNSVQSTKILPHPANSLNWINPKMLSLCFIQIPNYRYNLVIVIKFILNLWEWKTLKRHPDPVLRASPGQLPVLQRTAAEHVLSSSSQEPVILRHEWVHPLIMVYLQSAVH